MEEDSKIVFLAIGSIGDVLPLCRVAKHVCLRGQCSLITHLEHKEWLSPFVEGSGLTLHYVSTPPARVWNAQTDTQPLHSGASEDTEDVRLEEHLQACITALAIPGPMQNSGHVLDAKHLDQAQTAAGRRLLVHNLFAMEAISIADAHGVPALALSPCLVPSVAPASHQLRFKRKHPALCAALTRPEEEDPGSVRWSDVEHWLWPLFSPASCAWRQRRLGLGVPFSGQRLPAAPRLLYLLSPCLTQQLPYWPKSGRLCGHTMQHLASGESAGAGEHHHMAASRAPMECPSKPACSPSLVAQIAQADLRLQTRALGDSRAASKFSAIAARPDDGGVAHEVQQASEGALSGSKRPRADRGDAQQRKSQALPKPVLIDFGSVGCMGLLGDARRLLSVLLAAFEKTGLRATLLTGQWKALQEACTEAVTIVEGGQLHAVHGFVDHGAWMQQSSVAVHHGGMGTMLAALGAGLPAVACPLHFDQHQNADLLEHLELGVQIPGQLLAHGDVQEVAAALASALCQVLTAPRLLANARSMQQELQREDGVAIAVAVIQASAAHPQPPLLDARSLQVSPQGKLPVRLPNGWRICHSCPVEAAFIYEEIFEERCYIQHGIAVRDGDICVDVGANIGFFSLFLLGGFAGGLPSCVVSCEPAPANMRLLRENVERCGGTQKVTFVEKAVGRNTGSSVLTYYPHMPGNSTLYPEEKAQLQADMMPGTCFQEAERHTIDVTTLQNVLEGFDHVDLLKIDAEGAELDILQGADMETLSKIRQIVMEVHDVDERPLAVQQLLEMAGFRIIGRQKGECETALLFAKQLAHEMKSCLP